MSTSEKSADTTPGKSPLLWFLLGAAGVFLTSLFISVLTGWPMAETFLTLAIVTLVGFLLTSFARRSFIIIVPEHQRVVIYRGGKVIREAGPGTVAVWPLIENYRRVDVERVSREGGKKICAARDGVRLEVEYAIFWQVDKDKVALSVTRTENPGAAVKNLAEGEIAIAISKRKSADVREALARISNEVEQQLSKYLADIGLKVVALQIMNVTAADSEVQEAINRLAAAQMDAQALEARNRTAKSVGANALQVLYLDMLKALGDRKSTIYMPLELAYLRQLLSGLVTGTPSEATSTDKPADTPDTTPGGPKTNLPRSPETDG